MKPPRPSLNIEIFEDRLLPSSFMLDGFNRDTAFPTNPSHVSVRHLPDSTPADSGGDGTAITALPIYQGYTHNDSHGETTSSNLNSATDIQNQSVVNGEGRFDAYSNGSDNGGPPINPTRDFVGSESSADANEPTTSSVPPPTQVTTSGSTSGAINPRQPIGGLNGDGVEGSTLTISVTVVQIERFPNWFNRDNQLPANNYQEPLNTPDSTGDKVASDGSANESAVTPEVILSSLPPTPPPPPSSESDVAPTSSGLFVISYSLPSSDGAAYTPERPASADQHILSEVTLAAVSLMGPQGMPSLPAVPLVSVYPFSPTELKLPELAMNQQQLNVKANATITYEDSSTDISPAAPSPEVHLPAGETIAGVIGLDVEEVDARASHVLASLATLNGELTGEHGDPDLYAWISAAAILTVGAGYAVWKNRQSQRVAQFPLGRGSIGPWQGEEHDVRNR